MHTFFAEFFKIAVLGVALVLLLVWRELGKAGPLLEETPNSEVEPTYAGVAGSLRLSDARTSDRRLERA